MRDPDRFTVFILELLESVGAVSARRMFGGVGLFHGGVMFGLIVREELFLKVGDANRPAYEAASESPFSYETKNGTHTLASYWRCPPDLLDDGDTFRSWIREAIEAAAVSARSKPVKRQKPASPSRVR